MDQAILRAIVAPAKLVWKSQLGKNLISTYGIDDKNASSFPGAVTAVLTLSGDLEGRVLFILTEQTAKSVEAAFASRWDEGLNQRTLDSVSDLMKPVVENIPKLLETSGHECTVELTGVMISKGKGVAGGKESSEIIMLASLPDFDNPSAKDEISVWVILTGEGTNQDSESPGDERVEPDEVSPGDENEDAADDAGDLVASGASIGSDESLTQNEATILSELHEEFENIPEPDMISDQDIAEMMAEEALMAGESDSGGGEGEEEDGLSEQEEPVGGSVKVYPAIQVGVITTEKLEIVDSDGKVRSVLATLRDGSPYLAIADATGRIRATLRLNSEGDARLTFVNEMGAETWMAPRDEPPAREPEQARQRTPATPENGKSESTGPSSNGPSSNGRKSRPKAASAPSRRKPGGLKASPRRRPSKKSRVESTSGKNSETAVAERSRRGRPKTTGKTPRRRKAARPAGVR